MPVASDGGAPTDFVYWDVNNDPNHLGITGSQYDGSHTGPVSGAESFQLVGTPEPASFILLGSGLALAAVLRRKAARR